MTTPYDQVRFPYWGGIGSELDVHIERSNARARQLQRDAPDWAVRIPTDDRAVASIARDLIEATGWLRAR